jgi:Reticulon
MNIIANGAYLLAALIVGCFLYNNIASFTNRPPLPLPRFLKEGVSESDVRTYADRATTFINKGLGYAYRLANGREPALTGAAAGALYFVARLASTFSLLGLAYMAVLAAFSVPKVYELKKDEIDAAIDKIRSQATSAYDKYGAVVVNRIPRAATAKPAESSSQAKKEE